MLDFGNACLLTFPAAFTMFNVYLPKLLEARGGSTPTASLSESADNLEKSLWNVVIFALGGCPGAVVRPPSYNREALLTGSISLVHTSSNRLWGAGCHWP